jgi:hypothetical protein
VSLTPEQHLKARQLRAGDRSYENISIAIGCTVNEIKDALIPGWRETPCRYGRHAIQNQGGRE